MALTCSTSTKRRRGREQGATSDPDPRPALLAPYRRHDRALPRIPRGQAQVGSGCWLPLRGIHQKAARWYRSLGAQGATDTQLAFRSGEARARLRTRKGEEQQHRKIGKDADSKRRRQASANRTLTILKAALNMAWREGQVTSDAEWRRVEPFENVDAARIRYLKVEEAKRLINACEPDFRRLVQAALETGCRYGELTRLTCADFNPDTGTIAIRTSKTGKPRHVVLTEEGQKFFAQVCAGRPGNQLAFLKKDGSQWQKSNQKRPWDDAAERAKIDGASFHTLRHTWASLAVMAGVPLLVVAENLGHSDTRMVEKHYGHMSKSHVAEAIRAGAPRFGFKADTKVAALGGRT